MRSSSLQKKERRIIILFLFFPLVLLFLFGILPIITLVAYSFTSWNGISEHKTFIGLKNYVTILTNPTYFKVFTNSLYYFIGGLIEIGLALYFAIILSFNVRFKSFFKVIFAFPMLISGVAISMMFRLFFEPGGTFDFILSSLGFENSIRYWLGDPEVVNSTLAFVSLYRHMGVSFILYFGAIQTIPVEYYKALEIEGGNFYQKVRYVILPNIHTVLKVNFILLTIGALSVFEIPYILTSGNNGTATFLVQTIKTAFEKKMIGLASSMAVIVTLIIIVLTSIQRKVDKKYDEED